MKKLSSNKIKKGLGSNIFDVFNYIFLFFLMIVMIYPLVNVVALSFSSSSAITAGKVSWLPVGFNFHGYQVMLRNNELLVAYWNTIKYAFVGTFFTLLFTSMVAYTLSVKEFVFRKHITIMLTITMVFSGGLIPTFLNLKNLHMLNTFWVMVIPGCVSAYNVFVFRSFFDGISTELREAASIDGAGEFKIWYGIYMPISKAAIATIGLFAIVGHWNSWFNGLMYLKDTDKFPLQLVLRKIVILDEVRGGSYADSEVSNLMQSYNIHSKNIQMASIVISMLPILCIYPFLQKYFAKGVMLGSVKG